MATTTELLINIQANAGGAVSAINELEGQTRALNSSMAASGTAATATAAKHEQATGVLGKLGNEFANVGRIAVGMATGMVAADITMGIAERFQQAAEQIDRYGQASLRVQRITGGTAEDASTLVAIFQRYTPSLEEATTRLGRFERALAGQEDVGFKAPGGKTAGNFLQEFGVTAIDASGHLRPTLSVLEDLAEGFKNSGDEAQKNAALITLFGRGSQSMLLMLNQGRAGLEATAEAAKKYGLTLTGENLADVQAFAFAHKDLDMAMQGISLQLGATFMPIVTRAAMGVADFAKAINQQLIPALHAANEPGTSGGGSNPILDFGRSGGILGKIRDAVNLIPGESPAKSTVVGLLEAQITPTAAPPASAVDDAAKAEEERMKSLKDAFEEAKGAHDALNDAAAARKATFDLASLSDTQKLLEAKSQELTANSALLDYKRQIEDIDRNAVNFSQQRLQLEEERSLLLAQQAAGPLKNQSDDIKYQENLIKAQIQASRAGGPEVNRDALRQQLHSLQQQDRRLEPSLLLAEHDVTLAGRAKSATDQDASLAKNATDQLKLNVQQAMAPVDLAATQAKRVMEDQQHVVELQKQGFELQEMSYAVELAIATVREKGAAAIASAAEHPEAFPRLGPAETIPRPASATELPSSETAQGPLGPVEGPPSDITTKGFLHQVLNGQESQGVNVGDIHIGAGVGTSLDDVLQAVTEKIAAAWQAAMQGTPVAGSLGGSFQTGSAPR